MNITVCKFGGICLNTPSNIMRVLNIVKTDNTRKVVVVSAPGISKDDNVKITDKLITLHNKTSTNQDYSTIFNNITHQFMTIIKHFKLNEQKYKALFKDTINQILYNNSYHYTLSRGEYITAHIIADLTGFKFVDAKDIIAIDDNGVDLEQSQANLTSIVDSNTLNNGIVIPGFYGKDKNGNILTLSRDGTDYTASIVAYALCADKVESYKDITGIRQASPLYIPQVKVVPKLNYDQLRTLTYMGAKVLHASTVEPLRLKNIPLYIKNIYHPDNKGTCVNSTYKSYKPKALSVTGKDNLFCITINKNLHLKEHSYFDKLVKLLNKYNITSFYIDIYLHQTTILIEDKAFKHGTSKFITALQSLQPAAIITYQKASVYCVVGNSVTKLHDKIDKLQKALKGNLVAMSYDIKGDSFYFIVKNLSFKKTINKVYKLMF